MRLKDVVYANFTTLAYIGWDGIKSRTDIKDALFDIRKKNTRKLNTGSEHIYMAYSEDEKYESPLWDKEFDGWRFLFAGDGTKLYSAKGVDGVPSHGFYAVAFYKGKDVVISFRGTNDITDAIADIQLYTGSMSFQLLYAYEFTKYIITKYRNEFPNIHLVGHSLGGALVQSVMNTDLSNFVDTAVTFNAFGIKDLLDKWADKKVTDYCLLNCIGWMGLPNSGIIVNELKKLAGLESNPSRSKGGISLMNTLFTLEDVENIIDRSYNEYERTGATFNVVIEKDSKIFKNLKYRFGTVSSKPLAEREAEIEIGRTFSHRDPFNHIEGIQYKSWMLFDMLKYISNIIHKPVTNNRNNITNYIISKDLVGSCQPHLGKTIRVDSAILEDTMNNNGVYPKILDKALTRLHSAGNFFMFMNDAGMFDGRVRRVVLFNLVRDYIMGNKSFEKIFSNPDIPSIAKKSMDLVLNIPVLFSLDKAILAKYAFGYIYGDLLANLILPYNDTCITVGGYANIKHDGIDFNKGIIKIVIE